MILSAGPSCSFTDFVDQGDEDPVQSYLDSNGNWLFRMRMGTTAPNSKSYSILIDTDGKFGATGPNADPDYTSANPGFEIEIVLATNFGVYVYDVNNSNCNPVLSYTGSTNYQKSVALTTSCGNPDYFYDFFVKMSDLTTTFASQTPNPTTINASTPVRMAVVDNMGASKSTMCNPASASDIAGIDTSCGTAENCYTVIIDNYTPCAPGQVCPDRSLCPTINGPIVTNATLVSVTTTEAVGTIIKVYNGNTLIGTSAATTTSPQSVSITVSALATGSVIYATAQAPGEGVSIGNCDAETVTDCSVKTGTSVTITKISGSKGFDIANSFPSGTIITWYNSDFSLATIASGFGGNIPNPVTTTVSNQTVSFECKTGQCFPNSAYYFTFKEPGKCTSDYLLSCLYATGTSAAPAFTTSSVTTATSSISGTGINTAIVYLYVNGTQIGSTTVSGGVWTVPVSGL